MLRSERNTNTDGGKIDAKDGSYRITQNAHHIVQRGHNRQVVFADDADFERYVAAFRRYSWEFGVRVYAWCLMTNHIHLLLCPRDSSGQGKLMKRLTGRQTRDHNQLESRSGSLWEGRYKSSVVHREDYLRACCRYIELNPVRAFMVTAPCGYRRSSFRERMGLAWEGLLEVESTYLSLGLTESERRSRWFAYVQDAILLGEWAFIRQAVARGQLTGGQRFVEEISAVIGRRIRITKGVSLPLTGNKSWKSASSVQMVWLFILAYWMMAVASAKPKIL